MNDLPAQLRNIQDHLRTGRFGQREIWGRQLGDAASQIERLLAAMQDACDLLAEREQGSAARSPWHNARLRIEAALNRD